LRLWLTAPDSGEQYKHMSQNEKIIKQINEELENQKLEKLKREVRAYKLEQLELQEKKKTEKEKLEEELRIIKLNLENIDKGNFEAIEDRKKNSSVAKNQDPVQRVERIIEIWRDWHYSPPQYYQPPVIWSTSGENLIQYFTNAVSNATSGTFNLSNGKTFYF